jgi:acyl carrier protein
MKIHHAEGAYLTDRLIQLIEVETGKVVDERTELHVLDSLEQVELVMALEETFGLDIEDEDAEGWMTVGDIARWLAQEGVR